MRRLQKGEEGSYLKLYRDFAAVAAELMKEEQEEKPRTFWFRLWEKIKKILKFLRRVLMAAILVAAVIYMVNILRDDSGSRVEQKTMQQIGDLYIE